MMKKACGVCGIACLLVLIGALNWGSIGLLKVNFVHQLVGGIPKAERIIYILVGLAGLLKLISCFKDCPACKKT